MLSIHALAISVGNLHLQTEQAAEIDFAALRSIETVTRVPLVLHGGSGITLATRQTLAHLSHVKKFNIGTKLRMVFGKALRQTIADQPDQFDRIALLASTVLDMRQAAVRVMRNLVSPTHPISI